MTSALERSQAHKKSMHFFLLGTVKCAATVVSLPLRGQENRSFENQTDNGAKRKVPRVFIINMLLRTTMWKAAFMLNKPLLLCIQTSGEMETITYTNLPPKNMICSKNKQQLNVG